jgi:hypothetical protein
MSPSIIIYNSAYSRHFEMVLTPELSKAFKEGNLMLIAQRLLEAHPTNMSMATADRRAAFAKFIHILFTKGHINMNTKDMHYKASIRRDIQEGKLPYGGLEKTHIHIRDIEHWKRVREMRVYTVEVRRDAQGRFLGWKMKERLEFDGEGRKQ